MSLNWPEEHEDWWFDESWENNPALIAWELDHSISRAERTRLILSWYVPKEEDYTD